MENENWQGSLEKINQALEQERKILRDQLLQKIEELKKVKLDVNDFRESNLTISSAREKRIRELEKTVQELKSALVQEKSRAQALEDEVRANAIALEQIEREMVSIRQDRDAKVTQINQLKLELLPQAGLSPKSQRYRKLDRLEDEFNQTRQFYSEMAQRIDRILRA